MPGLARLYVRTSLVYLAAGALLGALLLWNKGIVLSPDLWALLNVHIDLVIWGWLLHFSLGVTYWILPRADGQRPRAWLVAGTYGCLNAGLIIAVLQPWLPGAWLPVAAGGLLFLAGLLFTLHAWPRARPGQVQSQRVEHLERVH